MASEAKIKLTLDDAQLIAELRKVGGGFDALAGKVNSVEKSADKMAKSASKSSEQLNSLAGKFVTFEMAKKMFTFADATLRAAKEMEGLSAEAKKGAEQYVQIADSVKGIGQNILLWATGFGETSGVLSGIRDLAVETADAWAYAVGLQTQAQKDIATQNKESDQWADLILLRGQLNAAKKDLEKESVQNNEQFYLLANESARDAEKAIDSLSAKMGLTANQIMAFKSGSSRESTMSKGIMETWGARYSASQGGTNKPIVASADGSYSGATTITTGVDPVLLKAQEDSDDAMSASIIENLKKENDAEDEAEVERIERFKQWLADEKTRQKKETEDGYNHKAYLDKKLADEYAYTEAVFQANATLFGGLSQLAMASAGKNKEMVKLALDLAELEAIANTAVGVTKAFAQGGVLGFMTGAGITAAGAAQVITIEKQKQKLAFGGLIDGAQSGDTVEVRANGGEMMLTKGDQVSLLQMIRGGEGGGQGGVYNFQPQYTRDTPNSTKQRDFREFSKMVKTVQTNRNYSRLNGAIV